MLDPSRPNPLNQSDDRANPCSNSIHASACFTVLIGAHHIYHPSPSHLSFPNHRPFLRLITLVSSLTPCSRSIPVRAIPSPDRHRAPLSDLPSQSSVTAPAPENCCAQILNSPAVSVATRPEMPPPPGKPPPTPVPTPLSRLSEVSAAPNAQKH
jgi:hypothetical protein